VLMGQLGRVSIEVSNHPDQRVSEQYDGMGRSGTLHAWQAENSDTQGYNCVPDMQTIGKGLGGGYQPIPNISRNFT
jgi:hypothetical protein